MFNKLKGNDSDRITINFEFDKGESIFEVGDTVSGTAIITANQDTVCNKIVIQMRWQTHGRGNRTAGKWIKETVQVSHNNLDANQTERVPFSFQLPEGPLTYRGNYLNVDWYLKAIVDARGPFDPSYEEEIIVLPKALNTAYVSNYNQHLAKNPNGQINRVNNPNTELIIGCAFLGAAIASVIIPLTMGFPFAIIFGIFPLIFAGFFFYKAIRNSISRQKLGPVKIELNQSELLPDESFSCKLSFNPLQDFTVKAITFRLQGDERVISGSGSNSKTHTNYIFKNEFTQLESKEIMANEAVELEQTLQLPPNAAYSFSATDNHIEWYCEVSIEIENWPNWKETLPLQVVPWRVGVANKFAPSTSWSDEDTTRASQIL